MKGEKRNIGYLASRVLDMRLSHRMFLIYIIGGVLPMILIGIYLIRGTARIMVKQVKNAEIVKVETSGERLEEMLASVNAVSKRFYFDEKLEKIATKNYDTYPEIVDDYRDYTVFNEYGSYYDNIIEWTSIYMENRTMTGNSHFVKADADTQKEEWYSLVKERGGGSIWQYVPVKPWNNYALSLTRLIKTKASEDVGVLVLSVRKERLQEILPEIRDSMLILNGQTIVNVKGKESLANSIHEYLPEKKTGMGQVNIKMGDEEYVMTCMTLDIKDSEDYLQLISLQSYHDILASANRQNQQSILFFCGSILLSVIMILLFTGAYGSRIDRFRCQMQKAASGEFLIDDTIGGKDEISELYGHLQTMILQIQKLLADIYREELHAKRLIIQQKEAEFRVLASQINPHFLYNTLETIRMKARVNKQTEIESLIKMLARILRNSLQAGNQDVTIQSEIELIECYLKIQQCRFGERISYHIEIESSLKEYLILPLLIQPIIENSIIHGLEEKEGLGTIEINVVARNQDIAIIIRDDGLGIHAEKMAQISRKMMNRNIDGNHIGILNVHQRIRLKYGDEYGVTINSIEGVGTQVTIMLPGGGGPKDVRESHI